MNGYGDPSSFKFPQGVILDRDLSKVHDVDHRNGDIEEFVNNSWYDNYKEGAETGRHPWEGETNIKYSGPQPPYEHLDVEQKYSKGQQVPSLIYTGQRVQHFLKSDAVEQQEQ